MAMLSAVNTEMFAVNMPITSGSFSRSQSSEDEEQRRDADDFFKTVERAEKYKERYERDRKKREELRKKRKKLKKRIKRENKFNDSINKAVMANIKDQTPSEDFDYKKAKQKDIERKQKARRRRLDERRAERRRRRYSFAYHLGELKLLNLKF